MYLKISSTSTKWRPFCFGLNVITYSLHWRHNGHDSVSNHQPHDCLLNRLLSRSSTKISKLRVTGLCVGSHRRQVNSPHKWPVTRKMFPFDEVIMLKPEQIGRHFADGIFDFLIAYSWKESFVIWLKFQWICYKGANCRQVSSGWGNGLVPLGTKPLNEPMMTQINDGYTSPSFHGLTIIWLITINLAINE